MAKYISRRLFYIVFVFLIISVLQFGIFKLIPGDPARMMMEGSKSSMDPDRYEAQYQAAREKLGLDKPVVIQYFRWLSNMLRGDFGYSIIYKTNVSQVVAAPLKNTILLNLGTLVLVFAITIPLGITTALRRHSFYDHFVQVFTVIGYSLPGFVIALLFICFFAVKIPLFPISGVSTPGFAGTSWQVLLDRLKYMALPLIVMTFSSLGSMTRYVRSAMLEVLRMDCIRTARAKGLGEKTVIYVHAFRNALIPIITVMTGWFIGIFSGSVVIERIFLWNGMGKILIDSLLQQDFSVVLALNMFYVVLALGGNLLMDIGYCLADPRVKLG
jgi:peptide/nickel transport system permease protein